MTSRTTGTPHTTKRGRAVRTAATIVAAVFTLVGVAGFIPGITTDHDGLAFAGNGSHAMLLGLFAVSVLHNLVHLVFGLAGFALARTANGARGYLIGGGAVYLALCVYGLLIDKGGAANFLPLNSADDWLHLGLGAGMIALGLALLPRERDLIAPQA
ncbi:DUF4383 domain-containing protein [Actinokineospora pegani]|uniref:DUF4383 domain-containing protein n=1 Tax=Actinokineospora pegani TaxID=2654637 RepID=UPI0012EAFB3A|nr:DUF4383 domain-containing protein [Actinokineospora pegani]